MTQHFYNLSPKSLINSLFNETSKTLWIINGSSGAGKTTYCTEIIEQALLVGKSVGGILCPAIYESGEKIRIDQVNIATGERRLLGTPACPTGERTVGCWMLGRAVLDWGNEILSELRNEDLIVIDELGPFELKEGRGYTEGVRLLDEEHYQHALVVVRQSLQPLALNRWPQARVLNIKSS